ncbi:MAG TPA: hypothetical protein VM240_12035 [Verrucomicrobiae bacterium]|nr:hypothetical protein [Verrucomicrobiae bacterium]
MSTIGKKIGIGIATLLTLAGVAGIVVLGQLGRLIERGVEREGPRITGTDVSLGSARVSIFDGEGSLNRLRIANPEGFSGGDAFDLGEIAIAVDVKSVTADVIHIRRLVIEAPRLLAEFDAAGSSNLDAIRAHARAASRDGGPAKQGADGGPEVRLIIDEFRFEKAEVRALAPAFDVDRTLVLPPVILKNLGAKQGGATASDIASQVLRPIVDAAIQAATREYLAAQRDKVGKKVEEQLMDKLFK